MDGPVSGPLDQLRGAVLWVFAARAAVSQEGAVFDAGEDHGQVPLLLPRASEPLLDG